MTEAELKKHAGRLIDWHENQEFDLEDAIAISGIAIVGLAMAMAKARDESLTVILESIITCMRSSIGATRQ